ncbi:MAG: type II toxin-antitoxin system Phd/YefM family antitoxin [Pseudomonadota bacterium]
MNKFNIHEAKTHLSAILAKLRPGDKVLICRRNTPIAEIRALPASPRKRRPFGLDSGKLTVPPSFFEPLSEDLIKSFEGASAR